MNAPLSERVFRAEIAAAPTQTADGGYRLDHDAAWQAYRADPQRWHRATQDNPQGDPVVALILADGPWWVHDNT